MTKSLLAFLVATLLSCSAVAAEGEKSAYDAASRACWNDWYAKRLAEIPKRDDALHPVTGKLLSQSPGAKITRAHKFQAFKDKMALRGKEDPAWQTFCEQCITAKVGGTGPRDQDRSDDCHRDYDRSDDWGEKLDDYRSSIAACLKNASSLDEARDCSDR